ncbi:MULTISPECIES: ABC transporter substrate-binding protein [unclassified Sinorhizobium]|uniref:ABC transporter substrate-binding protein n=1 Tax=unclassified Sinorhizobium TaxID=2613772 RepID=UPI0024C3BF9F|nr:MULTISPECIES: ABC transporter substrate-binding protein [unclassified Sinorhizobium]MDK1373666.1 ABC transporter substrate-binding protein [Sinorhizobium sp. 6-70]MDK1477773.1 ABC transporter substrate-binding protein [Sinorhizobium sp. 6-117]
MKRMTKTLAAGFALLLSQASLASAADLVWWTMNWNEQKAKDYAAEFMKENPDVKIRVEANVAGGLQSRILVALQSGSTPDLIDVQNGANIPLAQTGKLEPLRDKLTAAGVEFDNILPASLDTATYEGQLYGLPFQAEAHALIYNKGAFKEAGLDPEKPPQTWTEFIDYAKKLTRTNSKGQQVFGYGVSGGGADQPGNALFRSLPFMWMNGGGILSPDNKDVIVNSSASVEGVKLYVDLFTTYKVSPPSTLENDSNGLRRLFQVGNVAMIPGATSDIERIRAAAPDIEIGVGQLPHPEGKQTAVILGGWNFIIPKDAPNKEAAIRLAAFMSKPERQALYTTTFPAAMSGLDDKRFADPIMNAHKEMLKHARPQPTIPQWGQIGQIYYNHLQEALLQSSTVQEAMDSAASEIETLLSQ